MAVDDQDLAPVIRLDDAFVRNARFKEGTARQRGRRQRRDEKRQAKRARRQWRPRRVLQPKDWILPLIVVVVGLYLFKLPPFRPTPRPSVPEAGAVATPGETTSTTLELERRTYQPGDCVLWDQSNDGPTSRFTQVVPCDQPHLIEITGRATAEDSPAFPPESEWNRQIATGECARQAREYLGSDLDPYGRFIVSALRPTHQGWNQGDRELWCGFEAASRAADDDPMVLDLFPGSVKSQPQAMLWATGSCLGGQPGTGTFDGTVPCSDPHLYEIAGTVDAGPRFKTPPAPGSSLWASRLGRDCEKVAKARFGRALPAGVGTAVFPIDPASWQTGRRTTECAVARFDPVTHDPTVLATPLLPAR
jgi:hypothetical protein